jgi:hypothetical protein
MITISPLETPLDPGVRFEAPWAVDARDISVTQIGFSVAVNPFASIAESIDDNSLVLGTFNVIAAGTVKVEETKCLGGFELDGSCEDFNTIKLTADQGETSDRAKFPPVHVIGVKLKITISGGDVETGGASLDDFSVRFSEVPEPAAGWLCVPVVPILLLARRRGSEYLRLARMSVPETVREPG